MGHPLFFSLDKIKAQKSGSGGSLTSVTSDEVSGFTNISFCSLKLSKNGYQEPIWHPNANKIGYCLSGDALISIRSPGVIEVFTVKPGAIFFIPQGYIHLIENTGDRDVEIAFALNHSKPQSMYLSKAIGSLSESVFNATFSSSGDFVKGLQKKSNGELIKSLPNIGSHPSCISSRFKFNIASSAKTVQTRGGYLQLGIKLNLPVLEGLGILGFGLTPKGVVEPHWHTNAGELVYIVKGNTKITVLSPDGSVEVMEVNGGEGAFAPASHFHNIENVGQEDVEVIAFFNHADPDYIGIGEVVGSYSNDLLASVFNVDSHYLDALKKPQGPLVIVPV